MINNTNDILSQNINEVEGILMEYVHKIVKQEGEKNLNIDSSDIKIGLKFYFKPILSFILNVFVF